MTDRAAAYAALHGRCFTSPRPWSAAEFAAYLDDPMIISCGSTRGFMLGRVVVDEAEILTVAVAPAARRQGLGTSLITDFTTAATARGARSCFLEVAANNPAAIALYRRSGFAEVGRRKRYYVQAGSEPVDALIFSKRLDTA